MRFLIIFAVFILGCSKKSELTIAIGGAPQEIEIWEGIIEEFERREGIEVKIIRQASDTDLRRQHLLLALMAGSRDPDLFLMDVAWVTQFIESGWLLPLNINSEEFFDSSMDIVYRNGNIYAVPINIDCALLYYRKDLLEKYECDVPKTWEDLLNCALKAIEKREKPFYGFLWQGAQYEGLVCVFIEFAASGGGNLSKIYSKENIKVLRFMKDLIHKYGISPPDTYSSLKEEEVRLLFQSGMAMFERNWPYAYSLHLSEDSPVREVFGISLLPKFRGGKNASCLGGWYLGISSYSDVKGEALKLLKFLTSYKVQSEFVLRLGWNSARRDVMEDLGREYPHIKVIGKACERAVVRPLKPYYPLFSAILQRYINSVLSGHLDPEEALKRADEEISKLEFYYEDLK